LRTKEKTNGIGPLTESSQEWQFIRAKRWLVILISAVLLTPCWWHRHIEAGDLGSHVYNAWLAQLIEKGQAPGLYIAPQWNNVLVDWLLLHVGSLVGFGVAEKLVVSFCVLVFFWGVFAFVAASAERPPWFLAPCIAMLAYGYAFNMGFFNYYLSLGLAALSLALLWRGRGLARAAGVVLLPLVLLAHPLGFLWLVGTALYIFFWNKFAGWWKLAIPLAAVGLLLAVHWYLDDKPQFAADWDRPPFYVLNGADQLVLYSRRYAVIVAIAVLIGVLCVAMEVFPRLRDLSLWRSLRLPLGLYAVAVVTTALLPENLKPSATGGLIGLLDSRLTAITAIFGSCVLNQVRPRKFALPAFAACALAFFALLYHDTLVLNRMESNVESMVSALPFGTKVLSTIWAPPGSHIWFMSHLADRACIGRCFSFGNYEPSTGQFRVRARPGNAIVTASYDDSGDMQSGEYEVQDEDLPMKEIYQCDPKDLTKLCIRDLSSGELNGRLGYKPPSD
jgi:hypothetical protein